MTRALQVLPTKTSTEEANYQTQPPTVRKGAGGTVLGPIKGEIGGPTWRDLPLL